MYLFGFEACEGPNGGNCTGDVLAWSAATGRRLWDVGIVSEGQGNVTVGGGVVYVTDFVDGQGVFLLNATTGAPLGRLGHPGGVYTSQPVVVDGRVYVVGQAGSHGVLDRWGLG